jgi:glycosyltransferase involved in cell wall biosynthesis
MPDTAVAGRRGPPLTVASSYGRAAASTRVRVLDWLEHLGMDAEVLDYAGGADVRPRSLVRNPLGVLRAEAGLVRYRRRPPPERLLVSRSMSPLHGGRLEAAALRRAGWGVYDFDDALFADHRGGVHRFLGEGAGWARALVAADRVLAGNAHLAEAASRLHPDVVVVPSCVDPDRYPRKTDHAVGEVPRLVWLGSPSTEPYLQPVAPALLEVHRRTGARLTLISSGDRPLGALGTMADRVTWDTTTSGTLLATADCGIMPLPDTPFARGKCAYKLLQYGAVGLPAVASPVGVNAQVVDQLDALPATGHDQWVQALLAVLGEPGPRRRARGRRARDAVVAHYSFTAWAPVVRRARRLPEGERG